MKKYSKNKLLFKNYLKYLIIILFIIIVIGIAFVAYIKINNVIEFTNVDKSAMNISDEKAKLSTPIIVNNIVLGGVYKSEWVSTARYYNMSDFKKDIELRFYGKEGSSGVFTLLEVGKSLSNIIGLTDTTNTINEYVGIINEEQLSYIPLISKSEDIDSNKYNDKIKEVLGVYNIFNNSVNINKVHECYINNTDKATILEVTSNSNGNASGAYSAIIMIDNTGKAYLLKYNYVHNKEKAEDFKIYSVKFVIDLNDDGINEIITSGTDEFETMYSVLEFKKSKFVEVLSESLKN